MIDNGSTDNTIEATALAAKDAGITARVVQEPRLGLTYARRRAAEEATGGLLCYVDDDNLIDPDWVESCFAFFAVHSRAGVVGGRIDPEFEDPAAVPSDFHARFAMALAIRDFGPDPIQLVPPEQDPPCGAGMTVVTSLVRAVFEELSPRLSDRKGASLSSGGDTELGLLIHRLGGELWYDPKLRMRHILPASRLTQHYLDRLIAQGAESGPWLDYLRGRERIRSRFYYVARSLEESAVALRMDLLRRWRGRDGRHADRLGFWSSLARHRAAGFRWLARTYPFGSFEADVLRAKQLLLKEQA